MNPCLQQRNDGFGSVDEWTEFIVGQPLDSALFTWDGPVRLEADVREAGEAEHEADVARRREWFTANVSALPLQLLLEVDVLVHEYDDSGDFHGSIEQIGSLSRRRRSAEPWNLGRSGDRRRWSAADWEWELMLSGVKLSDTAFDALRRALATPPRGGTSGQA